MKELTNTPEHQSSDLDSDSDVNGTGPNPQRRRVRRRFYLVPLALVALLL